MTTKSPARRRRGGQPGNQNAKRNRGNRTERRHRFERGNRLGKGAQPGNQNARKRPKARHQIILADYRDNSEAAEWIKEHAAELDSAEFGADDERDRALFSGYQGLTPEALAESGRELKLGLFTTPDLRERDENGRAA
jgi:hypothetical protein